MVRCQGGALGEGGEKKTTRGRQKKWDYNDERETRQRWNKAHDRGVREQVGQVRVQLKVRIVFSISTEWMNTNRFLLRSFSDTSYYSSVVAGQLKWSKLPWLLAKGSGTWAESCKVKSASLIEPPWLLCHLRPSGDKRFAELPLEDAKLWPYRWSNLLLIAINAPVCTVYFDCPSLGVTVIMNEFLFVF